MRNYFVLFIIILTTSTAYAFDSVLSVTKQITLNANSLSRSLSTISQVYHTSFVADSITINNIEHIDINGNYTLEKLLSLLLKNQNITYKLIGKGILLYPKKSSNDSLDLTAKASQQEIENMLIIGTRTSSQTLQLDQANRKNLNDSLIAQYYNDQLGEYIGYGGLISLPNHNIAEAIGYLPGISISRFFGEGLTVNSRGLGPLYQSTSLNGHLLAINENVRNSGQSGRAFRFDVLPIQNVAKVNVIKTPTSDMADSVIGSSIAIETFKPLEFKKSQFISSVNFESGNELSQFSPQVSWLTNWVNSFRNLGVVFTGSHSERHVKQESLQTWDWELNGNSYLLEGIPRHVIVPSNRLALTVEEEKRKNFSLGLAAQWQVADELTLAMDHFYSELYLDFDEHRLLARLDSDLQPIQTIINNNVLMGSSFKQLLFKTSLETSRQKHNNYIGIFDANWQPKNWIVDLSVAYSTAQSVTDEPIRRTRFLTKPRPFSFLFSSELNNKAEFKLDNFPDEFVNFDGVDHVSARFISVDDKGVSTNLSVTHDLTSNVFQKIIFGGNWRHQSRAYNRQDLSLSVDEINNITLDSRYFSPIPIAFTLSSIDTNTKEVSWLTPNKNTQQAFSHLLVFKTSTSNDLINSYGINEQTKAAFMRVNYRIDAGFPVTGNMGLRWWYWQADISGAGLNKSAVLDNSTAIVSNNRIVIDDTQWLPSFTLNAKFSPQWQLKLSIANTLTLPSYSDFNPSVTLNSTDGVFLAKGGNPSLTPVEATQWDAGLYWYFADEANLSLGYFNKNIDNFIVDTAQLVEFEGEIYRFTQPVNAGEAKVSGWELGYSHNFQQGFGVQCNLTFIDSKATSESDFGRMSNQLEGVSKVSYNLVAFYEFAPWILRFGYDHRGSYLDNLSVTDVPSTWIDEQQNLKFYLGYQVTDAITLSISGRNLLTNPQQQYFKINDHKVIKNIIETEQSFLIGFSIRL